MTSVFCKDEGVGGVGWGDGRPGVQGIRWWKGHHI